MANVFVDHSTMEEADNLHGLSFTGNDNYEMVPPMEVMPLPTFVPEEYQLYVGMDAGAVSLLSEHEVNTVFQIQELEETVVLHALNQGDLMQPVCSTSIEAALVEGASLVGSFIDQGYDWSSRTIEEGDNSQVFPTMIQGEGHSGDENVDASYCSPGSATTVETANVAAGVQGCSESKENSYGNGQGKSKKLYLYEMDENEVPPEMKKKVRKAKRCKRYNDREKRQAKVDVEVVKQCSLIVDEVMAYVAKVKAEQDQETRKEMWNGELRRKFKKFEELYALMKATGFAQS